MPYCSNCGAYIPDGETVCISCGANSAPASSQTSAAAAAQKEDLHATLEEQRRRQQEKNREWAEQVKAERDSEKAHTTSGNTGGIPSSQKSPEIKGSINTSKLLAGLSYVSILCILPFLFTPKDEFAKFHGKQGIVLAVAAALIDIIGKISGIAGLALTVLRFYLIYKGIKNVVEGKQEELPYIGQFAEKLNFLD